MLTRPIARHALVLALSCLVIDGARARAEEPLTLSFDVPSSWKPVAGARHGRARYSFDATNGSHDVRVRFLGHRKGSEAEMFAPLAAAFVDADGKPVPVTKSALESKACPIQVGEASGTLVLGKKADWKAIECHLFARDGNWVVLLIGPEKRVTAHRDEFLAFVKSAKPSPGPMATPITDNEVAPELVTLFNSAAGAARDGKLDESIKLYDDLIARTEGLDPLDASGRFLGTAHLRAAWVLMDQKKYEAALARHERARPFVESSFGPNERFDFHFSLGNTYGSLKQLDKCFGEHLEAISIAEDQDDYVQRPTQCWKQILAAGIAAQDWTFVKTNAAKAQQNARVRQNAALEKHATQCLALAESKLAEKK